MSVSTESAFEAQTQSTSGAEATPLTSWILPVLRVLVLNGRRGELWRFFAASNENFRQDLDETLDK